MTDCAAWVGGKEYKVEKEGRALGRAQPLDLSSEAR